MKSYEVLRTEKKEPYLDVFEGKQVGMFGENSDSASIQLYCTFVLAGID